MDAPHKSEESTFREQSNDNPHTSCSEVLQWMHLLMSKTVDTNSKQSQHKSQRTSCSSSSGLIILGVVNKPIVEHAQECVDDMWCMLRRDSIYIPSVLLYKPEYNQSHTWIDYSEYHKELVLQQMEDSLKMLSDSCASHADAGPLIEIIEGKNKAGAGSVCAVYLSTLLHLLKLLQSSMDREVRHHIAHSVQLDTSHTLSEHTAHALPPDVLSIGQQATLAAVFQFVVALGISPGLQGGVGIPLGLRSKHAEVISELTDANKHRMAEVIQILLDVSQPPTIKAVLLSKHLGDLLASLMQLSFCGLHTSASAQITSSGQELIYKQSLSDLIDRSYPPMIVRELLTLQGGAGRKTPAWLRAACGHELTQILVSPGGVKNVVSGMVTAETDDWRKYQMVGRVIATPPRGWEVENYYNLLAPQILMMIAEPDQTLSKQFGRVTVAIMSAMLSKNKQLVLDMLWRPMTSDLESSNTDSQDKCITQLYKIICCVAEPQSEIVPLVIPHMISILNIYLRHVGQVLVTDAKVCGQGLLTSAIQYCDKVQLFNFLESLITPNEAMHPADISSEESRATAILDLLSGIRDTQVIEDFFLVLLETLSSLLSLKSGSTSATNLFTDGELNPEELSTLVKKFRVMTLLAGLCEVHSKSCLRKPENVISFVQSTLNHFLSADNCEFVDTETITLSLGLLTALLSGAKDVELAQSHHQQLASLCDSLQQISLMNIDDQVKQQALNIRVAIATHGLVRMSHGQKEARQQTSKNKINITPIPANCAEFKSSCQKTPTVNTLSSEVSPATSNTQQRTTNSQDKHVQEKKTPPVSVGTYEEALKDLCDPLIAVQGHGLIQLTKLINSGDAVTLTNQKTLLSIFKEHINHSDTYIYLSAINGITSLASRAPSDVINVLCAQFSSINLSPDTRLKVGEALSKATKLLGDTAPAYSDTILPAALIGCRADDEMLRASSLANLGELCKLLGYSLGSCCYEIIDCVCCCLQSDTSASVRQAAASSVSQIVGGLQDRTFSVLGGDNLTKLYKALKQCARLETDPPTLHHCAVAIEMLDSRVKDTLFPKQPFEKKIYVLDAPPTTTL